MACPLSSTPAGTLRIALPFLAILTNCPARKRSALAPLPQVSGPVEEGRPRGHFGSRKMCKHVLCKRSKNLFAYRRHSEGLRTAQPQPVLSPQCPEELLLLWIGNANAKLVSHSNSILVWLLRASSRSRAHGVTAGGSGLCMCSLHEVSLGSKSNPVLRSRNLRRCCK